MHSPPSPENHPEEIARILSEKHPLSVFRPVDAPVYHIPPPASSREGKGKGNVIFTTGTGRLRVEKIFGGAEGKLVSEASYPEVKLHMKSETFFRASEELDSVLNRVPGHMDTTKLLTEAGRRRAEAVERHLRKGIVYFLSEDMEEAIRLWNVVLELDPENKTALDYKKRAETIIKRHEEIKAQQSTNSLNQRQTIYRKTSETGD